MKHSILFRCLLSLILVGIIVIPALTGLAPVHAQDQAQSDSWKPPVNLSKSGGALQPMIMAEPDGKTHVMWWDQFDMTRYTFFTDHSGWNPVLSAPTIKEGTENHPPSTWKMFSDNNHQVYIFWTDQIANLWYAKSVTGTTNFNDGVILASGMVAWDVHIDASGKLDLAYAQAGGGSGLAAAGVYYRRSQNGISWGDPISLVSTPYFRTMKPDFGFISIAADSKGQIFITWDDPFEKRAQVSYSLNGGDTFSAPVAVITGEVAQGALARQARLLVDPSGKFLTLWQAGTSCALYQQEWTKQASEMTADKKGIVSGDAISAGWSPAHRVLETLNGCVQNYRYYPLSNGSLAMFVRTGTDVDTVSTPTLAVWDQKTWTEPVPLQVNVVDQMTKYLNALGCLDVTVVSDHLSAVGCDDNGDVWATSTTVTLSDFIAAQKMAWSAPQLVTAGDNPPADLPALAADTENRLHVIFPVMSPDWATGGTGSTGQNGVALAYVRLNPDSWTRPSLVLRSPVSQDAAKSALVVTQPALLSESDGLLHVAWSGGPTGQIYTTNAFPQDAGVSSGWSTPLVLPSVSAIGGSPSLAVDSSGKLYAAYAVPLNEGRGVYLTVSEDKGLTWLNPTPIFTVSSSPATSQSDMPMIGLVRLIIDDQGVLHVAWVAKGLPPESPALGVYYSRSIDAGLTWSQPLAVSQGPADRPQFCLASAGQLHLFWNKILDTGSELYQQWTLDSGVTWSDPTRVMNLLNISERVGLVADGQGTIYLVGLEHTPQDSVALISLRWDGATWWTAPEHLLLGFDWTEGGGVTAALEPGGKLVAFYRISIPNQDGILQPVLGFVQRTVEMRAVVPLPTLTPQTGPTATVLPTALALPTPIPTPKIPAVTPGGLSQNDLIRIGAIVIGMLVIVYLAFKGLTDRNKNR